MIYLELFLAFCYTSLFGFGGGYAMLPLIENVTVKHFGWLSAQEFLNLVTISQITPGPVLINSATFVGGKTAGFLGVLCATAGSILPSSVIMIFIAVIYYKYRNLESFKKMLSILRIAAVGLIAAAALTIISSVLIKGPLLELPSYDLLAFVLFSGCLFLLRKFKVNPILLILISGGVSAGFYAAGNFI